MPTAYVPSSLAPQTTSPHVRWMVARDLPRLVDGAEAGTRCPWSQEDLFVAIRNNPRCVGLVVEAEFDRTGEAGPAGYMIYTITEKNLVTIDRIVIAPEFRRQGYGGALLQKLQERGRMLRAIVRESDLELQLFFRSLGFTARSGSGIRRCYFEDTGEDGYEMTYGDPFYLGDKHG